MNICEITKLFQREGVQMAIIERWTWDIVAPLLSDSFYFTYADYYFTP